MSLKGNDQEKLKALSAKTYKDQAIWFLNAFFRKLGDAEHENIWNFAQKMAELDKDKGKEGSAIDEFQAHRFLEIFKETLTVLEMRDKLVQVGIEKTKSVPLTYYLIFHYSSDWKNLVNASQGDNQAEVEKAQKMLADVQTAFQEVQKTAEAAAQRQKESEQRQKESEQREKEAQLAVQAAKEAKAEQEKTLAEVKAQEDAYNNKTADLKRKTEEGGVVAQNKAKAELAQHLAEDPLPLRKAKITNEAAVKKAEKATKDAENAAVAATNARVEAEKAVAAAIAARAEAEAALDRAKVKVDEAEAYLDEVKAKPGVAEGSIWWMNRELHEAKKYLPERKGGIAHKKVEIK